MYNPGYMYYMYYTLGVHPPTWVGGNTLLIGGIRHKTATIDNYVIKKDY